MDTLKSIGVGLLALALAVGVAAIVVALAHAVPGLFVVAVVALGIAFLAWVVGSFIRGYFFSEKESA